MRKFTKIFSMALVLTMLVCTLASCNQEKKVEKLIDGAEEALAETAYTVDVRVKYESDNEEMAAAIKSFSSPTMKVCVDGDKFQARMDLKSGSDKNYITYTFVDGVLYTEWCEDGSTVQDKRSFSDEDKAALLDSFGAGASIGTEDFDEVAVKSAGKLSVIKCDVIKDDALNALIESLSEQLAFLNADVAIKNATLDIEIDDGRYNVVILTCEYYVTTATGYYSLTMTYSSKFTYENELEITAPSFS